MPLFIASTLAAVAAGCLTAFMFFWALLSFFFGGPDARVGQEAIIVGVISLLIAFASGWSAKILFAAPRRVADGTATAAHRYALRGSPLFALLFIGALWMLGVILVVYFVMIAAVTVAARLVRRGKGKKH